MAIDPQHKQTLREIAERAQANMTALRIEQLNHAYDRFHKNVAQIKHDSAVRLDLLRRLGKRYGEGGILRRGSIGGG